MNWGDLGGYGLSLGWGRHVLNVEIRLGDPRDFILADQIHGTVVIVEGGEGVHFFVMI
jgi:hypothetical protein